MGGEGSQGAEGTLCSWLKLCASISTEISWGRDIEGQILREEYQSNAREGYIWREREGYSGMDFKGQPLREGY